MFVITPFGFVQLRFLAVDRKIVPVRCRNVARDISNPLGQHIINQLIAPKHFLRKRVPTTNGVSAFGRYIEKLCPLDVEMSLATFQIR